MKLQRKFHFFSKKKSFFIYIIVNILLLSQFPFIHSDESWLSGLTREIFAIGGRPAAVEAPGGVASANGGSAPAGIDLTATEPFFDLLPRFPHFIKLLFHALQAPFIAVFGYGPFAVRLLSLAAGCLALLFFYRAVGAALGSVGMRLRAPEEEPASAARSAETQSSPSPAQPLTPRSWAGAACPSISFVTAALLALDIQFIYAAHFGRQEILLVATLTAALWVYFRELQAISAPAGAPAAHFLRGVLRGNGHRAAAMIIGLSIGIHPNAFLISLPIGAFLLVDVAAARSPAEFGSALRRGLEYAEILAAWAALFVGLSYLLDPHFWYHYRSFGDRVGVVEPLYIKAFRFPDFYQKLYYRISGTYYTPAIKVQFFLFGAALAAAPIAIFLGRDRGRQSETAPVKGTPAGRGAGRLILQLLAALLLLNIGTLILGKYSQPSIILHFPLYYLLIGLELAVCAERLARSGQTACMGNRRQLGKPNEPARIFMLVVPAALLLLTAANSTHNIGQELHLLPPKPREYYETYAEYGHNLHSFVPASATVLANLNAEYHFSRGRFYDYRNLEYLDEAGLSFADYIEKNSIEYIVYPEEMDLIYRQRPVWNILYGNVAAYYEDMQQFLAANCRPVGSFESPIYGMRITRYMGRKPWRVNVYRVD